jgi:biopolymer transport protein ExbD
MNLRKRHRGASAEVHTSAMNDIMFFLLLLVKLLLPKSSSGQSVSKKTINVSISKDLQYTVDKKVVAVNDLPTVLASYKKMATELTIVLYVDKTVAIQDVVAVMDVSQKLNIKMVLATEPK